MSAAQLWAFMRYFPLSFSHRIISETSLAVREQWELIISLSEIIDIVMAPTLFESTLFYFEYIYASFLEQFKELYPNASVRPKMHFLVHLPTIVRKNGPMRTFWTMNYERLNGKVKAPSHVMHNFRNPQLTLAYRRQCAILNSNGLKNKSDVSINSAFEMRISSFANVDVASFFSLSENDSISVTDCVTIFGTDFKKGSFLALEKSDRGFTFGQIDAILFESPNDPIFLLNLYSTLRFDQLSFSYLVQRTYPSLNCLCQIKDFLDFHPLDGFESDGKHFVRLKYCIL